MPSILKSLKWEFNERWTTTKPGVLPDGAPVNGAIGYIRKRISHLFRREILRINVQQRLISVVHLFAQLAVDNRSEGGRHKVNHDLFWQPQR